VVVVVVGLTTVHLSEVGMVVFLAVAVVGVELAVTHAAGHLVLADAARLVV
jgi:hypothetical protein